MILSINQPAYLPWLGYFERIAASDEHVVLDHVQFEKNSFTNRNRVRTAEGACWLTVPVLTAGRFGDLAIDEMRIDNSIDWRGKHWRTLEQNYRKAPYFAAHAEFFHDLYQRAWSRLAPLCAAVTRYLLDALAIDTPMVRSSELPATGRKNELVLNLCCGRGADTYLSGVLGREYLRLADFGAAGVEVVFQEFMHPRYRQWRGGDFLPGMSVIDLLFNCGPASRDVLMSGSVLSRGSA